MIEKEKDDLIPFLDPKRSDPTGMNKQAIGSAGEREKRREREKRVEREKQREREKRKYGIQINSLQNSDAEEQDESHHFTDHNSIMLQDKNNEPN